MTDRDFKYPIKFENKEKTVLLLDTVLATKDYLEYAVKHNLDILFTQTTSTGAIETIYEFIKQGYVARFEEQERFINGIKLDPAIYIRLLKEK